jgi:hypothetical protein
MRTWLMSFNRIREQNPYEIRRDAVSSFDAIIINFERALFSTLNIQCVDLLKRRETMIC